MIINCCRLKGALEKRKKKGSKKRHKTKQGESEGESDEGEENLEGNLKMEQERLEAERQSILQNKELLEEVQTAIICSKLLNDCRNERS